MHKKERYAETHFLRTRASEYMINGVYEATGLNLKEFLEQPTYMVEFIISTLRQLSSSTRSEAKIVEKELKKQGAGFDNIKKRN